MELVLLATLSYAILIIQQKKKKKKKKKKNITYGFDLMEIAT